MPCSAHAVIDVLDGIPSASPAVPPKLLELGRRVLLVGGDTGIDRSRHELRLPGRTETEG
jgi:hypothetical protein